jgi:ectoine hydroxylase-related dioxygenase (phytanoyl-CoA dioxygenase family)
MYKKITPKESELHIKEITDLGYTVVKKFIDKDLCDKFIEKVELLEVETSSATHQNITHNQAKDRTIYNLQFKDISFIKLFSDSNILDLIKPFLNDDFYAGIPKDQPNFLLSFFNARSSIAYLPLHIDSFIPFKGYQTNSMQIAISLNGQNSENGATTFLPGTHKSGKLPDRSIQQDKLEILSCDAGDALIWDSRLWHGALENHSQKDRWSLVATFRPWWMKQYFDPRGISQDLYCRLNDFEKYLLGFLSLSPTSENDGVVLKKTYNNLLNSVDEY